MTKSLAILCAHGMSGTSMKHHHNPSKQWYNEDTFSQYSRFMHHFERDIDDVPWESIYKGYLWKACLDSGIDLLNSGIISDFRILCTRGNFTKSSEKWLNKEYQRVCKEELDDEPFVIAVGKSFGAFDAVRAVDGFGNHQKYPVINTDCMFLIDPDDSLDWNNSAKYIIKPNVKRMINFIQNQRTGPVFDFPRSLRGHYVEAVEGNTSSICQNYAIKKDTYFPEGSEVFSGELVNHWTIDEYISTVGYKEKWKLSQLISLAVKDELPVNLE